MTGDDCSGDEAEHKHRFDGPSRKFAKVDQSGYGELATGIQRLDAAITSADIEAEDQLAQAEESLREWLRKRSDIDGSN